VSASTPRPTPDQVDPSTVAPHEHHWHDGPVDAQAAPPTFVRWCCRCPVALTMALAADVQGPAPDGCGAWFPDALRPRVWRATDASMAAWDAVFRAAASPAPVADSVGTPVGTPVGVGGVAVGLPGDGAVLGTPSPPDADPPPDGDALVIYPIVAVGDPPA
jgi:hypothetical protein